MKKNKKQPQNAVVFCYIGVLSKLLKLLRLQQQDEKPLELNKARSIKSKIIVLLDKSILVALTIIPSIITIRVYQVDIFYFSPICDIFFN